jgi:hypothetical protein
VLLNTPLLSDLYEGNFFLFFTLLFRGRTYIMQFYNSPAVFLDHGLDTLRGTELVSLIFVTIQAEHREKENLFYMM